MSYIKSFSTGRPTTSLIRDLTESMNDVQVIHRRKLSEAMLESTASKLFILKKLISADEFDSSDIAFVLINCYSAYTAHTGISRNTRYQVSIIEAVRELTPHLKSADGGDVNQIYKSLGFTANKGIDEQFYALIYSPSISKEEQSMRVIPAVTDQLHCLTGFNFDEPAMLDRLKSLIPVAVLGVLSEANFSDRIAAIQSGVFTPRPNEILDMHAHLKEERSQVVVSNNRLFKLKIGSSGMLTMSLHSSVVGLEITFSPVSTLELITFALNRANQVSVNSGFVGRELTVVPGDDYRFRIGEVNICLPVEEAMKLFRMIDEQTSFEHFTTYIEYSRHTLGDI